MINDENDDDDNDNILVICHASLAINVTMTNDDNYDDGDDNGLVICHIPYVRFNCDNDK